MAIMTSRQASQLQQYLVQLGVSWPAEKKFQGLSCTLAPPPSSRIQNDTAKDMAAKTFWPKAEKSTAGYGWNGRIRLGYS